ncbi:MAG: patatin-like phospholipase family protein [Bacteriovoracaceae bacterium]
MKNIDLSSLKNKKIALVCSGGVVKAAAWHVGVSLALEELGFSYKTNKSVLNKTPDALEISTLVGSSAGALVSIFLTAGLSPQDILNSTLHMGNSSLKPVSYSDLLSVRLAHKKPRQSVVYQPFEGLPSLVRKLLMPIVNTSGLFTTVGLENYIRKHVISSNRFEDYAADLFIVATQLDHSKKVIFSKYNYPNPAHDVTAVYQTGVNISEAAAGSMSVPPFYAPYPIISNDQLTYYIDGEIRETLSTHIAIDNQCDFIISSWTHTPYHYHDEVGSLINYGLPAICLQAIYLMIQKKIVDAREKRLTSADIINSVHEYMKSEKFSAKHTREIVSILERKLNYKPNIRLIDIYPKASNYSLFFSSAFSLNPKNSAKILKMGYRRTMEVFKNYDWQN